MIRTGATFAAAAAEYLRYIEDDRGRKATTVATYRSIIGARLLPTFGAMRLENITVEHVEAWLRTVDRATSTRIKSLAVLHGIFARARKVYRLPINPVAEVEKPPTAPER